MERRARLAGPNDGLSLGMVGLGLGLDLDFAFDLELTLGLAPSYGTASGA